MGKVEPKVASQWRKGNKGSKMADENKGSVQETLKEPTMTAKKQRRRVENEAINPKEQPDE